MARILVVEDGDLESDRLVALLTSFGHDVTLMSPERIANDAMLRLDSTCCYDVIIADPDAWKTARSVVTRVMNAVFPEAKDLKVDDAPRADCSGPHGRVLM